MSFWEFWRYQKLFNEDYEIYQTDTEFSSIFRLNV